VCVTLDNKAIPLLMTSPTQINAQVPPDTSVARHSLIVRAFDRNTVTAAQNVTVTKYAPAVYVNDQTGQAAIYHADGTPVSKSKPATRDEPIVMYAEGLGATTGGRVTAGNPSPGSPLAVTAAAQVFFGNPSYKEAAIIVDWSGLVPGQIGLYQLNLRVPGAHISGDALPVTLKIGGVSSPATGPVVPLVSVD